MPFGARALTALGALLLAHAAYSAHEHIHLLSLNPSAPGAASSSSSGGGIGSLTEHLPALKPPTASFQISTLPADITVETLVALLLLTVGIVLSAEPFKPIRWDEWAAEVERNRLRAETGGGAGASVDELGRRLYGGPGVEGYRWLDNGHRIGFLNIRKRRREFADWMRKGGEKESQ